jgi:hypothetical protein
MAFTELFDRQKNIDLEIPEWVTLYITKDTYQTSKLDMNIFLYELLEGFAIVGVIGVTLIFDEVAQSFESTFFTGLERSIQNFSKIRPYFKGVVCNSKSVELEPEKYICGPIVIIFDENIITIPDYLDQEKIGYLIDINSTLVVKTKLKNTVQLVEDAINQVGNPKIRLEEQWMNNWSKSILDRMIILVLINIMVKKDLFQENLFLFCYDYIDQIVMNAFNDRNLKAFWRKDND